MNAAACRRGLALGLVLGVLTVGCDEEPSQRARLSTTAQTSRPAPPTHQPPPVEPTKASAPVRFRASAAMRTVRHLAVDLGPREATSAAYRRAAVWVQQRFETLGYDVRRQHLRVPGGVSWGIPVDAGRTWNVIAEPPGFDPSQPYRIVGSHLDTVPQAPGAEDNASGVAVLLELAGLASVQPPGVPTVMVAFAAEEPRGDGDALHHFGSRAYVSAMTPDERRALTGMVSMDRVGVGSVVPVCTGAPGSPTGRGALLRTAQRVDVPAAACVNASSDHWSFQLAGMPATRVGGTSYPAYHSPADLPAVVSPVQLRRVAALMWAWLRR